MIDRIAGHLALGLRFGMPGVTSAFTVTLDEF
jgi:hypothetical protein